jgi:hypothetical protein
LVSFDDIQGPLAPPASLAAEPDPVMAAFHSERHARFRQLVAVLAGGSFGGSGLGGSSARGNPEPPDPGPATAGKHDGKPRQRPPAN